MVNLIFNWRWDKMHNKKIKSQKEKYLNEIDADLITAMLFYIRRELDRCYWNKYQKSMISPFDNTGKKYTNEYFTVRAYDWNGNYLPNFECGGLKIFWYKYCGRGIYVIPSDNFSILQLPTILYDCKKAIRKDFGNGEV